MVGSGSVNTSVIASDKPDVYMGCSVRVQLHAVEELGVFSSLFGTVEYTNAESSVIT